MIKKKLFIWVCDYSENSGEGKLARLFTKSLISKDLYKLIFIKNKSIKQKYISSIFGIFYCWNKYLNNEKVCYLNYLPFWNFLIFIFLPPKTIMGPITGGANFTKTNKFQYLIRKFLFPVFYKISEYFLNLRKTEIIFSTELLKNYLNKKTIKKSNFNFVLNSYVKKNKVKKKIDLLIYFRNHKNKKNFFPYDFVRKLANKKFNIYIIGDKLNIPLVHNCGKLSNQKVLKLQSIAKYTISSGENLYSFFIIECLSNNVKVIVNKSQKSKIKFYKKNFIKINYGKSTDLKKLKAL